MYITKEKFEQICKNHSSLLVLDSDISEALEFVHELLCAEADALKEREPYATNSIKKLNDAAYQVFEVCGEIENEEFLEEEGALPKCVSIPGGALELDADFFSYSEDGSVSYDKETLADIVGEYLSDTYGYCHGGFHIQLACFDGRVDEIVAMDIQWDVDKEEELRVVRTLDELEEYLDDNGWSVYKDEDGWDIRQASPAGEDFGFFIRHGDDVEKAIKEIKEYAYDFDIDEHVELNLGGRGAPGVSELVEDAKEIQKMLDLLADGVNWCEQKTLGETLAEAEERSEGYYGYTLEEWNQLSEDEQIRIQDKYEYDQQHPDQADWFID